jgi:methyl-accepting chemotaxis protein
LGDKKGIGRLIYGITALVISVAILSVAVFASVMYYRMLWNEELQSVVSQLNELHPKFDGWFTTQFNGVTRDLAYLNSRNNIPRNDIRNYFAKVLENSKGEYTEVYAGWPDGNAVFGGGSQPGPEWVVYERPWYTEAAKNPGEIVVSTPYIDAITNRLCISISSTIAPTNADRGVTSVDIMMDTLSDYLKQVSSLKNTYTYLVDNEGNILDHPNPTFAPDAQGRFKNIKTIDNGFHADYWNQIHNEGDFSLIRSNDFEGNDSFFVASHLSSVDWYIISVIHNNVVFAPFYRFILIISIIFLLAVSFSIFLVSSVVSRVVTRPVGFFTQVAGEISNGNVDLLIEPEKYTGEMRSLAESFSDTINSVKTQSNLMEMVARGDYSMSAPVRSDKDVMNISINHMITNTNDTLNQINKTASQVASSASQIAGGAHSLATASTEQAASIEELSASITEVSQKTRENAEMAAKAAALADQIMKNAESGSVHMEEMTTAVKDINEASQSISNVMKVIDDMAFQTNILALTAAVEAARAGEHGKGFAVVAEEVRKLAAKSAAAAMDTETLIANSMEKAEFGVRVAQETAAYLNEIVSGINNSNKIVNAIAKYSEDQSSSIREIDKAVEQIAQVVQQNSATAQESAATSEDLSGQSNQLEELIGQFHLKD